MSTRSIILALLLAVSGTVVGQSLFGNQKPVRKQINVQRTRQTRTAPAARPVARVAGRAAGASTTAAPAVAKDTACYLSLTKRFGWYYGIGDKLTKDEMRHLPCYYRLTEPDSLGHFTRIEAVNGRGLLTTRHSLSTYLVGNDDDSDQGADSNWKNMLQTVVQWELIPAIDGHHAAIESGLDADGNLIYSYVMSVVNDTTIVGHYTDSFGEPVSLRTGSNAAKYTQVTIDAQGYERRIMYLNDRAYFKENTDGAYMQKKDYDAAGNVVCLLSCWMDGQPVKDRWGNCGWTAQYNARGQLLRKLYVDEHRQSMRMPRRVETSVDVITRNYDYDSLRMTREYYLTEQGVKDATREGVHCREWTFDTWGNVLSETSRDSVGRLCNDRRGIARTVYAYDDHSRETSRYYTDKDGLYVNDADTLCMYCGHDTYRTTDGRDTIPVFKKVVTPLEEKTVDYKKDLVTIVRRDRQGRQVELAYYNLLMRPVEVEGDSCFRLTTAYRTDRNNQIQEDRRYSFRDTILTRTVTDTKELTRLVQRFHGSRLLSTFGQTLNEEMEVTGQLGYDALGNRARSHLEDALYFRVNSGVTYRGDKSYIMGRNEYDEPSYVVESESGSSEIYCTKLYSAGGRSIMLDENNEKIPSDSLRKFRQRLNRAYCVELVKQRAWQLGLRSGDVIVKYGEFYYPEVSPEVWKFRDRLQMDTYLSRNQKKEVLVLRYDEKLRRHRMVRLTLPPGTEGELGFIIQTVYYTQRESDRYNSAVQQWLREQGIHREDFEINEKHYGTHVVNQMRPFKISTATMPSWKAGLCEDALVVAVVSYNIDGTVEYAGMGDGDKKVWDMISDKCDSMGVYYTTNGRELRYVMLPGTGSACSASFCHLPTEEFNALLELEEKNIPQALRDSLAKTKTLLLPEQAVRFIRRHASTDGSFLKMASDSDFERILRNFSNQTGVDVTDCGMTAIMGAWVKSTTTSDDRKLIDTAFKRVDYTGYERTEANGFTLYYHRSTADAERLAECVVAGPAYLLVLKGELSLSIDTIKGGTYDKLH